MKRFDIGKGDGTSTIKELINSVQTNSFNQSRPCKHYTNMGYADEVSHAHKEKVSTDKVRDGNYQTADTIFDDNGVVLEKNNIEDIPKAHIPIII